MFTVLLEFGNIKNDMLVLHTIEYGSDINEYYVAINKINELLRNYFAQVDQAFCFYKMNNPGRNPSPVRRMEITNPFVGNHISVKKEITLSTKTL